MARPVTLITGASAGLGVEFARQCARRGEALALVARRRERLDALAAEVGDQVHVFAADLALPDAAVSLINAVEAAEADRRGRILVTVDRTRERDRDYVRVVVEDNGHGIPSHQMQKIFLPFFSTNSHGTGLGLSLVQKIVLAHNGRVEVQSVESKGTRFVLTLPQTEKVVTG